jgi:hypothetical protein
MKNIFTPRSKILFTVIFAVSVVSSGCISGKKLPNLDRIFANVKTQKGKRPIIIIPGILGSELVNSKTGEKVWLDISPVKGDGLSLPISPDLEQNRDSLEPRNIIETAKLFKFFPEISVYQALIQAMENYGGYKRGDWESPGTDGAADKYFVFAYDWRRDNVENARILTRKILELKQKLNAPNLRFNVIAHSMGGLVARYAAMYGDTDLPENGTAAKPNWNGAEFFNKIFMFGTPNEGSMGALKVIIEGYSIGSFSISSLNSEAIITSPAIFQLLPHPSAAKFYDQNLERIQVDLYDPETWKKFRWSAYTNRPFLNKFKGQPNAIDKNGNPSEFSDVSLEELDAYFKNVLSRSKSFHEALSADTTVPPSIGFFAFGGDCDETLDGAVIVENQKLNVRETWFTSRSFTNSDGTKISKDAMKKLLFAPGDGSVTRTSLLASNISQINEGSPIFRKSLPVSATFFCESHDELPNNKIMQDNFLTALISEISQ